MISTKVGPGSAPRPSSAGDGVRAGLAIVTSIDAVAVTRRWSGQTAEAPGVLSAGRRLLGRPPAQGDELDGEAVLVISTIATVGRRPLRPARPPWLG